MLMQICRKIYSKVCPKIDHRYDLQMKKKTNEIITFFCFCKTRFFIRISKKKKKNVNGHTSFTKYVILQQTKITRFVCEKINLIKLNFLLK